ncbi:class I SAM-dependent methyltransferase [Streptomyces mirabilis]|uniref:class I SAM-dependent methyltransferase n=1 Tax=Streptomyces mirabilis TaxID=68239 RepID=UPI0036E61C0A
MPRSDTAHPRPVWYFSEYAPVGIDLGSKAAVAAYDRNQGTDPQADDTLLDRLGVSDGTQLVDLACGTGSLAVQAARRGAVAHGVDVSEEMLAFAKARADRFGVAPQWHHAGFLDYTHQGPLADAVTTKSALHQLPDFWKQQALLNAAGMLRPGGSFYLWDVSPAGTGVSRGEPDRAATDDRDVVVGGCGCRHGVSLRRSSVSPAGDLGEGAVEGGRQ